MPSSDWDSGSRNTNGVERANSLAKTSDRKISLYGAMQSLYEKDKMFALQYITATEGLKISYRSDVDQAQRSNSAFKRKTQHEAHKDIQCLFGPPDKRQHFDGAPRKESKKRKGKSVPADITSKGDKEVEVLYSDGKWWLSSFNFETGKWIVQFYDDSETTEVKFPDKDVRVIN